MSAGLWRGEMTLDRLPVPRVGDELTTADPIEGLPVGSRVRVGGMFYVRHDAGWLSAWRPDGFRCADDLLDISPVTVIEVTP